MPIDLMGVGSILSGLGGIAGMFQDNSANKLQAQTNALNYLEQRRANQQRERLSDELLRMQKEGFTTAEGTTRYVPGVGYVSDYEPNVLGAIRGNQYDEMFRNVFEAQDARRERGRNVRRRADENTIADELLREFRRIGPVSTEEAEGIARDDARGPVNAAYDRVADSIAQGMLKRGQTQNQIEIDQFASGRSQAIANAEGGVRTRGMQLKDALYDTKRGQAGNLYNLFATRASGIRDPNFSPTNAGTNLNALGANKSNTAPNAYGIAMSGINPAQLNYDRPVQATALGIGSLGQAIYGYGKQKNNRDFLDRLVESNRKGELG